ncbi:hypothetical protein LWP59_00705 [Amycolatopsis acidiphila]|uniref:Uncharacterized protein n=1 Tax=Amycolatopsis acidiphila TaxID=715473 RepID=A0A558AML9_9PSEU|nr:hypothetical protein [Amycolatopsis acidiphila]TVT25513.1 hypothetical protein FNH06_01475 [Amycolatopsis acidiphila]UIJ60255.1 hypothetical protein LWP59_00705 [Amycolatopsis acidiphila]GHG60477.1 hypothetical protein GCM10017788_14240 [Amycolatopsis acidiphila]
MSPVSRGRKAKNKNKKKPAGLDPELRAGFDEALEAFEEVVDSDDVLDVELLTAEILGSFWLPENPDAAAQEVAFPLIGYAAAKQSPAGFGLLRALQALGPVEELRERAGTAADRLAALGMRELRWTGALREVEVTECWQQADVYGDQVFLLFRCERGGRRHGLVVEIERFAGIDEIYLTTQEDEILAELRENDDELLSTERIPLPLARRIVEDAVAVTDSLPAQADDEEYPFTDARAYLLARLRAMPAAEPRPEPKRYGDQVLDEFLATEKDADGEYLRLLAEFGEDVDEADPLRVTPAKFELFLDDAFNEHEIDEEALRRTVLAFARWQGARDGLSQAAVDHLRAEIEEMFAAGEVPA